MTPRTHWSGPEKCGNAKDAPKTSDPGAVTCYRCGANIALAARRRQDEAYREMATRIVGRIMGDARVVDISIDADAAVVRRTRESVFVAVWLRVADAAPETFPLFDGGPK